MTETKALTYPKLAEAIGRSEIAARSMAKRNRWRRLLGNDGRARVVVPIEVLEKLQAKAAARSDGEPDHEPDAGSAGGPDHGSDQRALIAVLESRVSELQGRVTELDVEAKQGRAALARVDVLDALLASERERLAEIKTERDCLLAALTERRSWWPWQRRA